jgi:D-galactarolactone cycloisomerase
MKEADFYLEFDQTENALREDLTDPKIEMIDGKLLVPKKPGLGLEVNQEALEHYTKKTIKVEDLEKLIK